MASTTQDVPPTEAPKPNPPAGEEHEEKKPVEESTPSALEVKDVSATSESKDVDPEAVKAPGLVERAKEEVEAAAEALQEKLDLKKEEGSESTGTKPKESKSKEEQSSVFKRLLKKLGWK